MSCKLWREKNTLFVHNQKYILNRFYMVKSSNINLDFTINIFMKMALGHQRKNIEKEILRISMCTHQCRDSCYFIKSQSMEKEQILCTLYAYTRLLCLFLCHILPSQFGYHASWRESMQINSKSRCYDALSRFPTRSLCLPPCVFATTLHITTIKT